MNTNSKDRLLEDWAKHIGSAARSGALTGKPITISHAEVISGPRAGAIEMLAGIDAGKLLRVFTKSDGATLRQFVTWRFTGDPQCYMSGRCVRVEAGWPDRLSETMIRLGDLGQFPKSGGRWHVGRNEHGQKTTAILDDKRAHYLISGGTGSGKSVALRSAVLQLSQDPDNRLILLDGKFGESLAQVSHLPNVVAPVATSGPDVRAALGWACQQMRERYQNDNKQGRLIVVFDEIQEFCEDAAVVGLLKKLTAQGRAANVHCLLATQHPTIGVFGSAATRRNLTARIALLVADADASRVAIGSSTPRADHLLGSGDAYACSPGNVNRVQCAFVDDKEIGKAGSGQHLFDTWPEFDAEGVGQDLPQPGRPRRAIAHSEIGTSLISAMEGEGRPAFKTRLEAEGLGRPGSDRARTLLTLGRQVKGWLEAHDVGLCYLDGDGQEWGIEATA